MTVDAPAALAGRTPLSMLARLSGMMFLQYFVQGCYLPIISLYLQEALGFTSTQIGMFGSALAVGPLAAPFIIGQIVDRHVATEYVLAFCHAAGGIIMLALYWLDDLLIALGWSNIFWPAVVLGTLYSTLYVPTMMLTNSLAFHHLGDRDREFPWVRLWGTIGFIVPAWVVERVLLSGLEGEELAEARGIVLALAGVGGIVMAIYSFTLPHTPPAKNAATELAPRKILDLFAVRSFLVLVLVSLLIAVAHKFYFVWNSVYLQAILQSGGVEEPWEQTISSIGQVFEVVVMAGLAFSIVRLGFKWTMVIGAAAYLLRCLVFAGAIAWDGPFPAVMTIVCLGQALHGVCFGCFLAAAYMFVDRLSSVDVRGTIQNFYGTFVIGVGFFLGGFVAGGIGESFTAQEGTATVRDRLGIATRAGLAPVFRREEVADEQWVYIQTDLVRDWTGIWLACAAIALVALIGFVLAFPRSRNDKNP